VTEAAEGPPRLAERRFLLVGLTGGIATGKSTVSSMFRALGAEIIDADLLAREVVEPGQPAYETIVSEFGPGVVQPDGGLDRKKLGAIVFADPTRRKRLEAITHPAIRARFMAHLADLIARGFAGIAFFDAPVMIESGNYKNMDKLVVVATDDTTQRSRLHGRDGSPSDEIERKIGSQMPVAEKAKLADYVVDNSGDRAATEAQVARVYVALLEDLRALSRS
jgi:dephospho-CoA kinase